MPKTKIVEPQTATTKPEQAVEKIGMLAFVIPLNQSICDDHVATVKREVKDSVSKKANLIVYSAGGDPYSAVKIVRTLRTKFDQISGIVPAIAMSAATLMLLGTDQIFMCEESQLGPLDLPIEHPTDGSTISALDMVNTLNQLGSTISAIAGELFEDMRKYLPNGEKISKNEAIKLALQTATEIVKPISTQIDPYQRQKAFRKLKIGQNYAFDLLSKGMLKKNIYQALVSARKFVHSFPDHSYAIFREEAREALKLSIKDSSDYPDWAEICEDIKDKSSNFRNVYIKYWEV